MRFSLIDPPIEMKISAGETDCIGIKNPLENKWIQVGVDIDKREHHTYLIICEVCRWRSLKAAGRLSGDFLEEPIPADHVGFFKVELKYVEYLPGGTGILFWFFLGQCSECNSIYMNPARGYFPDTLERKC
jgi:hypothetical protein